MSLSHLIQRARQLKLPTALFPLALLGLMGLAYGILLPRLGFYWDDFPILWISQKIGPGGLERYFATNRPFWGELYKLTTSLLGDRPLTWQLFGFAWRWVTAVLFWAIFRRVFPRQPELAAWGAVLFAVYPGFRQQSIAFMYSHFYIVLSSFLLSLLLMLVLLRRPARPWLFWLLTGLGLLLSLYNLLAMEYFFLLDLARPALIWLALSGDGLPARSRLRRTALAWLPYLLVFIGAVVWRVFFFRYQTTNYEFSFLDLFKAQPLVALGLLAFNSLKEIGQAVFGAWLQVFRFPDPAVLGARSTLLYAGVVAAAFLGLLAFLLALRKNVIDRSEQKYGAVGMAALGLLLLALGGWPFWLTGTPIGLAFPQDRFTLVFMPGASLLAAGLVALIPARRWVQGLLIALLAALAAGLQFQTAVDFSRAWNLQKSLFWQLSWRVPALEPGTTVLANEFPLAYYTDNSLSAPLNWLYAGQVNEQMPYILYYPTVRVGRALPGLEPGQSIDQNYLAASFHGNTSQMLAIYFDGVGCLRVLDRELEPHNAMLPGAIREAAGVSVLATILTGAGQAAPPPEIYGPEPDHRWCYYYQKASLAVQQGDWPLAAGLGDEAFALGDYPNDPVERAPFIEAYAHTGQWQRALELSRETNAITPLMQPPLCSLWERIAAETGPGGEQAAAVAAAHQELGCTD